MTRYTKIVRKRVVALVLCVSLAACAPVIYTMYRYDYRYLDAFARLRSKAIGAHSTVYSSQYSEALFRSIVPGMSASQVVMTLGEPFSTFTLGVSGTWIAAYATGSANYDAREIVYSVGGHSIGKTGNVLPFSSRAIVVDRRNYYYAAK